MSLVFSAHLNIFLLLFYKIHTFSPKLCSLRIWSYQILQEKKQRRQFHHHLLLAQTACFMPFGIFTQHTWNIYKGWPKVPRSPAGKKKRKVSLGAPWTFPFGVWADHGDTVVAVCGARHSPAPLPLMLSPASTIGAPGA